MADAAQEVGFARAWSSATGFARNAGEKEVLMALAIILPLGALALGLCRGRCLAQTVYTCSRIAAVQTVKREELHFLYFLCTSKVCML